MPLTDELFGWKAIAAYLGVAVRTAQDYANNRRLPVYRHPGEKGRVYARPSELDEWRVNKPRLLAELDKSADRGATPNSQAVLSSTDSGTRRQWLKYGLVAGAAALTGAEVATTTHKLRSPTERVPASCRLDGQVLVLYGSDGVEIGRHLLPNTVNQSSCTLADLEGDGRNRILFEYTPATPFSGTRLVCLNPDGTRSWEFVPGHAVTDNRNMEFLPPFSAGAIALFRPRGSNRDHVVISCPHTYSFPDQLAILDSQTGRVIREYWHRGHLNYLAVADLDGDGEPEILASGVNDAPEFKEATLLIFDHRRISGATPHPAGGSYFKGMLPVPAKHTIFFPKTAVSQKEEFNRAFAIGIYPEGLVVQVIEGISPASAAAVIYEFDYSLRVRNVTLTDMLQNRLHELQESGVVPREPVEVIAERLKRSVTVS